MAELEKNIDPNILEKDLTNYIEKLSALIPETKEEEKHKDFILLNLADFLEIVTKMKNERLENEETITVSSLFLDQLGDLLDSIENILKDEEGE